MAFEGLVKNVERRYRETGSESSKQEYESFMRITPCPTCKGQRLKKEALAVTVGDKNIHEVTSMSIRKLQVFLNDLVLTPTQQMIGEQVLKEIRARVGFLMNVGLEYLTLSRATGTLSGGEAQRIRLATQIGSGLVGVAYILDEPSIGLHQRDNDKLLATLKHLRDLGNTLIDLLPYIRLIFPLHKIVCQHFKNILESGLYIPHILQNLLFSALVALKQIQQDSHCYTDKNKTEFIPYGSCPEVMRGPEMCSDNCIDRHGILPSHKQADPHQQKYKHPICDPLPAHMTEDHPG